MSALEALRHWLAPILDPFSALPSHLGALQGNHLGSLNEFRSLMAGLVLAGPPGASFSGPAATSAQGYLEDFVTLFSADGAIAEVTDATATCVAELEVATETLATAAADESVLLEITATLDVVSVAQGGLDPFTDVPAIILTVIAGTVLISALVAFGWAVYEAVQKWNAAMHQAGGSWYPTPPPISKGAGGPRASLADSQEEMAKRLYADYGHLGLSLDDIRDLIARNPNLNEAELRALLEKYAALKRINPSIGTPTGPAAATVLAVLGQNPLLSEQQLTDLLSEYDDVIASNPNLVRRYGATAVFLSFVALAAYSAAHGGNFSTRQPANPADLPEGITEARAMLGAMEKGKVPWPFSPSVDPTYEGTDGSGQKWDVKSYRSVDSAGNPFDSDKARDMVRREKARGEKVILDDSQLTPREIAELQEKLVGAGLDGDVVWWPHEP